MTIFGTEIVFLISMDGCNSQFNTNSCQIESNSSITIIKLFSRELFSKLQSAFPALFQRARCCAISRKPNEDF